MVQKFVLPKDDKAYEKFIGHHFTQLAISRTPIPPLYHYTSGDNLIKIIKSGKLWTTQIACLNDSKELIHSVDIFLRAFSESVANKTDDVSLSLYNKLRDLLVEPDPKTSPEFIACFSEHPDDLSQWRAYGGGGGGYAIKFDADQLLSRVSDLNGYLFPVTYEGSITKSLIDDVIKWTGNFFRDGLDNQRAPSTGEWLDEFAERWLEHLSRLAPLIKHPAFKAEQEWRIIYYLTDTDFKQLKFSERSLMMRRHLPLALGDQNHLPIREVIVGPQPHQELSKIAVADLLKSTGYSNIPVTLSDIPYRTAR